MSIAPGLHIIPPRPLVPLAPAAVDVPAFIGIAAQGVVGAPVAVDGWLGFRASFGDKLPNAQLGWAVRGFFENGGRRCHVIRVAAPEVMTATDPTAIQPPDHGASIVLDAQGFAPGAAVFATQEITSASAGVQPADRASSFLADIDGFAGGARIELFQPGLPRAWRTVVAIEPAMRRLAWDAALPISFDLVQPILFTARRNALLLLASVAGNVLGWQAPLPPSFALDKPIAFASGAAAASGALLDEDGEPVLRVAATTPGGFGNAVEVRLARTIGGEARTRVVAVPDAVDALSVDALANLVPGATLTISQTGAPATRRRVRGIDGTARRVLLDAALPAGFDLAGAATGAKPIALRRETFALSVLQAGRLVETHAALDLPATAGGAVALTSSLIGAWRLGTVAQYPLPDPAAGPGPLGRVQLAGGRDGIAALRAADLITAIGLLAPVDEPAALAIPDAQPDPLRAVLFAPPQPAAPDPCALCPPQVAPSADTPPPVIVEATPPFTLADLRAVQSAMILHCEQRGDRIALLDAARDLSSADPFDPDAARDWRVGLDSRFAALYWPWLRVVDTDDPRGTFRDVPPCGHVLGAFARSDIAQGVQKAPANAPLDWVQAVTRETDPVRLGLLNDAGINVIRPFTSRGIRIFGARLLAPDPDHRLLNVRRILIQLRRALLHGLAWVPFEPDNFRLRAMLRGALEAFLDDYWQRGALAGATRGEAFAVSFDPPADGTLTINIAVAPVSPAEFVYLTLTRTDEAITASEPTAATEQGG